jgi:hypothetical protein
MNRYDNAVQEAIQEAVERELSAIKYNITNVIGGLLYSLKLEIEKKGGVSDIDTLVRIVVDSSKYDGPEGEEYPVWNDDNPDAVKIVKRLQDALQEHGIEQSWNIGRANHLKKG